MRTNILQVRKALLALFAMLMPLVASAHDFEVDGIYYNITSETDKTVEVTYKEDLFDSSIGTYFRSITVPATVTHNGVTYSVTSIGDKAFFGCFYLTAINIPEGVTSIASSAFCGCSRLTAITIPEGVTSIGKSAFSGCSSLTAVTIPENPQLTSIGSSAFSICSSLTAITIPEGVTSIGSSAFAYCSSLAAIVVAEGNKVYDSRNGCNAIIETCSNTLIQGCSATIIPEGVTSIGEYAFYGCSSLTSITIPENSQLTSIASSAFSGCSSLTSINIPEGVTSIENFAFYNCSSLTSITIPENSQLTSIGEITFSGCSSLTTITLPEGVTSIASSAFYGCSSLTTITIPERVTSIGEYAFYGCSSLTAIVLPKSVKDIYSKAFAGCSELTDVYCYAESVPSTEADAFDGFYPEYATLHVPESAVESYKSITPWSNFGKIVPLTEEEAAISNASASRIKVQGHHGTLRITGTTEGEAISVYTMDGMLVAQESAEESETEFTLPTGQVYIVTVADKVVKIGL